MNTPKPAMPRAFFVTNMNKVKNTDLNQFEDVKKISDVLRVCSTYGLWPIK